MKRPVLFVAFGMMLGIALVALIIGIAANVLAQSRTRLVSGADIDVSIQTLRPTETVGVRAPGNAADAFLQDREHETEDKLREAYDDVLKVTVASTRLPELTASPAPTRTPHPVASPTDDRSRDDADATRTPETDDDGGGESSGDTSVPPPSQSGPQPQPTEDRSRDDSDDHNATPLPQPQPHPTEDRSREDSDDHAATPRPEPTEDRSERDGGDDKSEPSPEATPKPDEDDNPGREGGEDEKSKP